MSEIFNVLLVLAIALMIIGWTTSYFFVKPDDENKDEPLNKKGKISFAIAILGTILAIVIAVVALVNACFKTFGITTCIFVIVIIVSFIIIAKKVK